MSENIRFYNLLAHIKSGDDVREENVALKNIWDHGGNIMLNLYFYRDKSSKVIDSAYIKDIFDLSTEKLYTSCSVLLRDFNEFKAETTENKATVTKKTPVNLELLEVLKDDITILLYIAKCIDYFSEIKKKTILQYIEQHHPHPQSLSKNYVESCLKALQPTTEEFYQAADNLNQKTPEEAEELVQAAVKICIGDGFLAYNEKIYLAELLQILREQGVEPDVGL